MTTLDEINEAKDKYLDSMNRVNLLLLREHDLRRDEACYRDELKKVQSLIESIKAGRKNGMNIDAEDRYLRQTIKSNEMQIKKLKRKLQGSEIMAEVKDLTAEKQKYFKMISPDFLTNIQHKLSTIRGKVDELKKKIKEINKEILSYEQEQTEVVDNYSFNLRILKNYKEKNAQLQEKIDALKARLNQKS